MKNRIRNLLLVFTGILAGVTLTSGAQAAAARLTATRSNCAIYIDGQRTELTAYVINDENYVRLRASAQRWTSTSTGTAQSRSNRTSLTPAWRRTIRRGRPQSRKVP